MEIVDTMSGKWKMDPSGTDNADAFFAAMEMPADMIQKMKDMKDMTTEMTRDGNTIKVVNTTGPQVETFEFELGKTFTSHTHGITSENTFKVEGNVMVGEHEIHGKKTVSRRYLKDGKIQIDSDFNGTKMTYVYVKC